MVAGDIIQLVVQGSLEGQLTNNVLNYKVMESAGAGATLLEFTTAWAAAVKADWLDAVSLEWEMVALRAQVVLPVKLDPFIELMGGADVGTVAGDSLPSFNAAVISWRTGIASRKKRGRTYIAGIPESGTTKSLLTAGEVGLLQNLKDALLAEVVAGAGGNTANLRLIVRSLSGGGETVITTGEVRSTVYTQRRRLLGRGV